MRSVCCLQPKDTFTRATGAKGPSSIGPTVETLLVSRRRIIMRGRSTSMNNNNLDSQHGVMRNVSSVTTEPRSTIDLLRVQTATHHHHLENGLRIEDRLCEGEARGPLVAGYFAFYRETEAALGPHLRAVPDLAFPARVHARQTLSKTGNLRGRTLLGNLGFPRDRNQGRSARRILRPRGIDFGRKEDLEDAEEPRRIDRRPSIPGSVWQGRCCAVADLPEGPRARNRTRSINHERVRFRCDKGFRFCGDVPA